MFTYVKETSNVYDGTLPPLSIFFFFFFFTGVFPKPINIARNVL